MWVVAMSVFPKSRRMKRTTDLAQKLLLLLLPTPPLLLLLLLSERSSCADVAPACEEVCGWPPPFRPLLLMATSEVTATSQCPEECGDSGHGRAAAAHAMATSQSPR